MVPYLSIVCMAISVLLSIGFPVALIIWAMNKYRPGFIPVLVGILVFVVTQVLIRFNLIGAFTTSQAGLSFILANPILYIAILSLTAGLFEEGGRFLAYKVLMKNKREWRHGIAYGIGHGGIEAVILVSIPFIANIANSILINQGGLTLSALPAEMVSQLQVIAPVLINTPSLMFMIGGLERVFTIILHIALSLLVLYGVNRKKIGYLFLAMFAHGLGNFIAVYLMQYVNVFVSEGFMLIVAILSTVYVVKMRKVFEVTNSL